MREPRRATAPRLAGRATFATSSATRAAVAELAGETGPFRVLVNNAGNDDRHALEDITPEYWDERFADESAAPVLRRAGRGGADGGGGRRLHRQSRARSPG